MYAATLLLLMSMPLVLASPWSFVIMLIYIPIIALRICKEEQVFVICDFLFVIFDVFYA
jgi:protein-S-isoprenylcysteine O-methyltransferase Ste14